MTAAICAFAVALAVELSWVHLLLFFVFVDRTDALMRSLFTSSRVWLVAILTAAPFALSARTLAATERTIPVSFAPHPNSTSLIELDRGRNHGLRLGDRGSIALPGLVAENNTVFAATDIPFTIEDVFEDRAIARIPRNLPPLQPRSARVTVLDLDPSDLGQPDPSPADTTASDETFPPPTVEDDTEALANETAIATESEKPGEAEPSEETGVSDDPALEEGWVAIERIRLERTVVLPSETCTPDSATSNLPQTPCLNVAPADAIARAILAGRDPQTISDRDAVGTTNVDNIDESLERAISYYLRYPNRPKAALALGQAYLRYQQPVQAEFWLADIEDDGSDPAFSDALIHARAYAAYQNGFYREAIALGNRFNSPTTAQKVLLAAAHFQRHNYARAADILEGLPSLPEVVNNRAIALQALDRELEVACEVERVGSMERCAENPLAVERQRQDRARKLLEAIASKSPTAQFNLAILDIRANDFEAAHARVADLHDRVAERTPGDTPTPNDTTLALQRATLWYVNNYQENVVYLQSTAFPHANFGFNGPTVGTMGQLLQAGLSPLALGNVVFLAISDARHDALVTRVTNQLRHTFLHQLDFLPVVSPPDPVTVNAYETFLESSSS
ncbi:MAG: hypothetical protein AAF704_06840 [Cyanobacteria bacterium P01_D01_bin.123]